jgi:hypothetical protein
MSDNYDWYSNTTSDEVVRELQLSALNTLKSLIGYQRFFLEDLEAAIAKNEPCAFPISHPQYVIEKALTIYNEIARANGAALVRGKRPRIDEDENDI